MARRWMWLLLFVAARSACSMAADADGCPRTAPAPELVTLKLDEYQDLYRQARLHDERQTIESERKSLREEYEGKLRALERERQSLREGAEQKSSERGRVLSGNWLLVNHSAEGAFHAAALGDAEDQGMATFDFVLDLLIFEDAWTAIPLIDARTIVGGWEVWRKAGSQRASGEDEWVPAALGPEMLLTTKARVLVQAEDGDEVMEDHVLVTNHSGSYRLRFRTHSHVQNSRSLNSLSLSLTYPLSTAVFRLRHQGEGQSLARSSIREFNVEPASYYNMVETEDGTEVSLRVPSTKSIKLKWRAVAASAEKRAAEAAQAGGADGSAAASSPASSAEPRSQATVQHDALFSLAEGVLQSANTFKFSLDAEQSVSDVQIVVYGNARVTSVVAHGMQTWRASPLANATREDGTEGNGTLVQVVFKSSTISREVIVQLGTESEFGLASGVVDLPLIVCRDVVRQTGSIAVVKTASAEVYEHASKGVARASIGEIPSFVRSRTDRPIVLAYRYLSPRYSVVLSVLHHEEVQTLSSVADSALYQVLVVDALRMHKFTLVVQSSQQQYMVVRDVPPDATIWSLRVNSLSTKPVRNRDGMLMVPLLVGTGGDSNEGGAAPQASVELAWASEHESLGENGSVVLTPPRVDMPITALSVEVQFPEQYSVNFTGTLKPVSIFSHKQPRSVNYQTERHVVEEGYKFGAPPPPAEEKASVKATIPRQGARYRFERILVVGDNAALAASYRVNRTAAASSSSWWEGMLSRFRS